MKKLSLFVIGVTLATSLTGCVNTANPNSYDVCEAGVPKKVAYGTIIAKRPVKINAKGGVGGLVGTTAGAVAGSAIGGGSRANILAGIGGAVIGGLVGNAVDNKVNSFPAFEYVIRLRNGDTISVSQAEQLQLHINQPVMVIFGPRTRVIAA